MEIINKKSKYFENIIIENISCYQVLYIDVELNNSKKEILKFITMLRLQEINVIKSTI